MEIILLKDVDKVGDKHTVVTVKNGYGRNFLIPQGLALIANSTNMRRLDDLRRRESKKENTLLDHYKEILTSLEGKVLKIGAKAGTSGKIFGSVTNIQISAALKSQFDVEIARRKIDMPEEIKNLGLYKATLKLHPEVEGKIEFDVFAE